MPLSHILHFFYHDFHQLFLYHSLYLQRYLFFFFLNCHSLTIHLTLSLSLFWFLSTTGSKLNIFFLNLFLLFFFVFIAIFKSSLKPQNHPYVLLNLWFLMQNMYCKEAVKNSIFFIPLNFKLNLFTGYSIQLIIVKII